MTLQPSSLAPMPEKAVRRRTGGGKIARQDAITGLVIELPLPPSVNTYVRKLGNTSPGVRRWRLLADGYLQEHWRWLKTQAVKGPFLIDITWTKAERGKSDIDNRIKPLLDYLQSRELIENDKMCVEMRVGFGETKFGCRVEVLPRREVKCTSDASPVGK